MINSGLDQKINHDRILTCKKIEGQKYSEQEDVKEVQLGGAKILLKYRGDTKITQYTLRQKISNSSQKGKLDILFKQTKWN